MTNFRWIDYLENSSCFVNDETISCGRVNYKNNEVADFTTKRKFKLLKRNLEEQKLEAQDILLEYWNNCVKEFLPRVTEK